MKKLVIGILAHVDAGKTTLSEALLYESGSLRKMGRVDNGDAFLDTNEMERERGITIFSKQAEFTYKDMGISLLDTPGHVDFSAEMERTLQVLDAAILVVSGADGVQGHTRTLWRLLDRYGVPAFLFINKMDQPGTDKAALLCEVQDKLDEGCIDFGAAGTEPFYESIAMTEEAVLEHFLKDGLIEKAVICRLIRERRVFPCFFGSALRIEGVKPLLEGLLEYMDSPVYPDSFGARVFKVARDVQGNRLTYLKITGGRLKVRDLLCGQGKGADGQPTEWEEKVNQIRIYSGEKYETVNEVPAGCICAVTGLTRTFPGEGLGSEQASELPILEPVLTYRVILPPDIDAAAILPKLRLLEEEEPQLHLVWDETLQEIQVRIMGEVQLEILQRLVKDRFGIVVEFGQGSVVYKETIAEPAVGVGHFEPLRHYAEVHLLLEPGEPGSGLQFASACSEDVLGRNWQRLILTHLEEKEHRGVLTGAPITDMKITLVAGRAHLKHTEGGDFRQATYRAVRQGLMEAASVLLEPYYAFTLEIPENLIGRAMTDIERMSGRLMPPQIEGGDAVLSGQAPVAAMQGYQKEVTAYSQGRGRLTCTLAGYLPCHNTEEILAASKYDPEGDLANPTGSVFCAHGAGFVVPWYEVKEYMHLEENGYAGIRRDISLTENGGQEVSVGQVQGVTGDRRAMTQTGKGQAAEIVLGTDEIDRILERTFHANKRDESERKGIYRRKPPKEKVTDSVTRSFRPTPKREEYLLVDGYNVIFAWEELAEISKVSIDGARGRLMDILCDYQAVRGCEVIVVFDAYRVQGHATEITDYHNIHVVFTREAETADQFIEKFAHENGRKYQVTVATSDGLEQIIIRGQGCSLLSARDLKTEIDRAKDRLREEYLEAPKEKGSKYYLMDGFTGEEQKL
ncbi:MAG: NYN domain-containing protein [Lachnospiraceae bacterium]